MVLENGGHVTNSYHVTNSNGHVTKFPPCTLEVEYWKRSPEVEELKTAHVEEVDNSWSSREAKILGEVLCNEDIALEINLFPYDTPCGIKHYTLWSKEELSHSEICRFVERWCHSHYCDQVSSWNYEENKHRSIDVPHVHVFIQFKKIQPHQHSIMRRVDDSLHNCAVDKIAAHPSDINPVPASTSLRGSNNFNSRKRAHAPDPHRPNSPSSCLAQPWESDDSDSALGVSNILDFPNASVPDKGLASPSSPSSYPHRTDARSKRPRHSTTRCR
mmetsp:Transcript_30610/g.41452  ORF Transcript_30610/g.41452 Transcript_30610/m.41452 type:complete len:273 (-) Transcript_30610:859-1677(-)